MRTGVILLAVAVGGLAACDNAKPPTSVEASFATDRGSLLALLASTTTPDSSRIAADRKFCERNGISDEHRLQVLEQVLYAPGQPDDMRVYAIDALLAADRARLATLLSLYLPRMQPPVLDHACTAAITLDDPRLVGPLVRSLARDISVPREKRAEIAAILHLTGKPEVTHALLHVLGDSRANDVRYAVLSVLPELADPAAVKTWIRQSPARADDTFHKAIQWSLTAFDYVPVGRNELEWSRSLMEPARHEHVLPVHRSLLKQEGYVYAPRFAGVLALAHSVPEPLLRSSDRAALLADIESRMPDRHIARRPTDESAAPDDESLKGHIEKLTHADLMTITALLHNLASPAFRREVLRLGLADTTDTSTEHGGLLALRPPGTPLDASLDLIRYTPFDTGDDRAYRASDKLFAATPTGIAHFHLHFQQIRNDALAGPGPGDLAYARTNRVNCVVFTSIARNTFDVDYYTPAGAVVDLGVYTSE